MTDSRRDAGEASLPDWLGRAARAFHAHLLVSGALVGLLSVVNLVGGGGWWAFWPTLAAAVALGLHFLLFKTVAVDERWAAGRAEELHLKSYDRGHIQSIAERGGLTTPADRAGERDRRPASS